MLEGERSFAREELTKGIIVSPNGEHQKVLIPAETLEKIKGANGIINMDGEDIWLVPVDDKPIIPIFNIYTKVVPRVTPDKLN